jgi:hypothetical protein
MAHFGINDKKRRDISLHGPKVKEVLPAWFQSENPRLITLLESYFEWLETNAPGNLLEHLFETKDLLKVDDSLLEFVEDELLLGQAYFGGFPDRRTAAIFANVLYKTKGSKFSIQQFFRMFLNEDVDIIYPKENVFKLKTSVDDFQTYNLVPTINKTRNYTFGYVDLLRDPDDTLFIINSSEFQHSSQVCKLKNLLGSTQLQIVNSNTGTVVVSNIGNYDPVTGFVTITGFTPTAITSGDQFIEIIGRRVYDLNQSFIGPDSRKYITDDKLYQTYAIQVKSGFSRSDWESLYKLFVHPAGMYLGSQVQIVSVSNLEVDDIPNVVLQPPVPIIYEAQAGIAASGFLSASGLIVVPGLPAGAGNTIRIELEGVEDNVTKYQDLTVTQLSQQYSSIVDVMRATSMVFSEDHDADSTGVGFDNTLERFDQDRWFAWSSDSATNAAQIVYRNDSDSY